MWILTTAVAVLGSLCWVTCGILGYRRVLILGRQVDASEAKRVIRTWSLRSGVGLSLLLGSFFTLLIAQSAAELGWSQQHGVVLVVMLAVALLGGIWTAWFFYWEAQRKIKRQIQRDSRALDVRER